MSLSEIKSVIAELSPEQLAELSAFIQTRETAGSEGPFTSWPEFPVYDGGPMDGAANHDEYLYGKVGQIPPAASQK